MGRHGTHWQPGRPGQGGLNLKTRLKQCQHEGFAGSAPDVQYQASQQVTCHAFPNLNLSYLYNMVDFRNINARGTAVWWTALLCARNPWFEARIMHIFAKCFIRVYTDLYPDIQRSYAYIRSCISMYAFIRVYTQIYSVLTRIYSLVSVCTLSYVYIRSCTCIYWFVLSTDQYILNTDQYILSITFLILLFISYYFPNRNATHHCKDRTCFTVHSCIVPWLTFCF